MSSYLTYRPREAIVFGVVAGKPVRQATLSPSFGLDVGAARALGPTRFTLWDHPQEPPPSALPAGPGQRLAVADNAALEIFDYPGFYAQRFDGIDKGGGGKVPNHRLHAHVVRVTPRGPAGRGFAIHGPPACGGARCIVLAQHWESLFSALRTTRQISIVVEI